MHITTKTIGAYVSSPGALAELTFENGMSAQQLAFSEHDMTDMGWTRIGTAVIELDVMGREQLIDTQITALRDLKKRTLAAAEAAATEIDARIQNLLALTYEPA